MFFAEALAYRCPRIEEGAVIGSQYKRRFGFLGMNILPASIEDIFIMVNRNDRGLRKTADELL